MVCAAVRSGSGCKNAISALLRKLFDLLCVRNVSYTGQIKNQKELDDYLLIVYRWLTDNRQA